MPDSKEMAEMLDWRANQPSQKQVVCALEDLKVLRSFETIPAGTTPKTPHQAAIAFLRGEAQKEEVLDILPSKGEKGPSLIRPALELV